MILTKRADRVDDGLDAFRGSGVVVCQVGCGEFFRCGGAAAIEREQVLSGLRGAAHRVGWGRGRVARLLRLGRVRSPRVGRRVLGRCGSRASPPDDRVQLIDCGSRAGPGRVSHAGCRGLRWGVSPEVARGVGGKLLPSPLRITCTSNDVRKHRLGRGMQGVGPRFAGVRNPRKSRSGDVLRRTCPPPLCPDPRCCCLPRAAGHIRAPASGATSERRAGGPGAARAGRGPGFRS